jgi:hypothetical protein
MGILDLTIEKNEPENKPDRMYWDRRNQSIERQVAVKAVAQVMTGINPNDLRQEDITRLFNIFIKLIRGE